MDVSIVDILQTKFSAGSPQVPLAVPVALQIAVNGAHQREGSDVKLSIFVEQWLLYVLLNDVTPFVSVDVSVCDQVFNLVEVFADRDATTTVSVLAWFNNPEVLSKLGVLIEHGLSPCVGLAVDVLELQELGVAQSFLDVEGQWQLGVVLDTQSFEIGPQVVVECLFV